VGLRTEATEIVYVVDRSGSMLGSFDDLRNDVFTSVAGLDPRSQDFHILLFSCGRSLELGDKMLWPATAGHKMAAAEFLRSSYAVGQTDAVPALLRAFEVLDRAPAGRKAIFLLTDSQFPDNEEVIHLCKACNARKDVRIFTVLYGGRADGAEQVMKRIAAEGGGEYRLAVAEE
jgi:uncharacterized protein with von Willebrand factor type A (vWA) domain